MAFAKLDSGITKSSVWSTAYHVRIVWVSFLAEKDENGLVSGSRTGLARICNVTQEEFDNAVSVLESPDPDSQTPDNEGRRIARVNGGWLVLNHELHRLPEQIKKEQAKERVKRYRALHGVTERYEALHSVTGALPSVSVSVSESVSGVKDKGYGEKEVFEPPEHLTSVWPKWVEHRRLMGKPMTTYSAKKIINKLAKLSENKDDHAKILQQSIDECWLGVFSLKEGSNGKTGFHNGSGKNNAGRPGYDEHGRALGAQAKPGEFDEGILTLDGVPNHR